MKIIKKLILKKDFRVQNPFNKHHSNYMAKTTEIATFTVR